MTYGAKRRDWKTVSDSKWDQLYFIVPCRRAGEPNMKLALFISKRANESLFKSIAISFVTPTEPKK